MIGFDGDCAPKGSGSRMQSHLVNDSLQTNRCQEQEHRFRPRRLSELRNPSAWGRFPPRTWRRLRKPLLSWHAAGQLGTPTPLGPSATRSRERWGRKQRTANCTRRILGQASSDAGSIPAISTACAGGGHLAAARFRVDQPSPCSRLPPLRAARPEVRGPSKSGLL